LERWVDPYRIFDHVFSNEVAIAAVVFGLVCLTILVAMALSRRRRRAGMEPSHVEKSTPVEGAYALAVLGVVIFVLTLSFSTTAQETTGSRPDAAQVTVTGYQWCWRFNYPGHPISITATCQPGQARQRPTMIVPAGRPVTIHVRASDVIHSWWVPALRYKMDAFPNHTNTFTLNLPKAGRWLGHCAQYCGDRHRSMEFYLKAVPAKQYDHWLASGGSASTLA
jgi:cytochrome c oxidase subunit 2